ncbi:MAG: hypothetical protein COT45_01045 [bacterium (Candidatus Stahlbacteria) CG08_land_8_20_14_0_20_40_26]|nr:MAG: hypothetical protein COX49_00955 [bacterium (Candidatus Stahlbacteria) CG23_combo_of_CG06-09_8_20_14_all_40_9]PIS26313.1 MAG: hypothetical protein COT45_01045 [bacterium (Candidatus Stahlbacteria) CG08_land_8_20_14_0_20_40_26]
MKRIIATVLISISTYLFSGEVSFPRTPALSPDGERIAFSYEGDIWVVPDSGGRAVRFTSKGYNCRPMWSPDGKYIAFNCDRNKNFDVYAISLDNGFLKQVTYYTGDDMLQGWDPRTGNILFTSKRELSHRGTVPYTIGLTGGNPRPVLEFIVSDISVSKDEMIAFTRGYYSWWRKGYRGSASSDIWISEGDSVYLLFGEHTEHNDGYPMWGDSGILYFLSDRNGTSNIYRYSFATGELQQLTYFEDDGVRYPAIDGRGERIVFERGFGLYMLDTRTLKVRDIEIEVIEEEWKDEWLTECKDISEFATSNGVVAFILRGDVYVGDTSGGKARRITDCSARAMDLEFVEEGEVLYFASDRDGNYDIYRIKSSDKDMKRLDISLSLKEEKIISTFFDEHTPKVSPDGKKIAFIRNRGKLIVYDLKRKKERLLSEEWRVGEYEWSPDSRWIAYRGENYIDDIYVVNVETEEVWNISKHPDPDICPVWSGDGRMLAFSSEREGDEYDIWWVYLRKEDDEKTEEDWKREKLITKKDSIPCVKIDFEDIDKRVRRGTKLPGDAIIFSISPDNERFIFRSNHTGKADLYTIGKKNGDLKPLTTGGVEPEQVVVEDNKVYYLSKGKIRRTDMGGKEGEGIDFDIREKIDIKAEREQMFGEVWRTLRNEFYDEDFHGVDWNSMYDKYREQVLRMKHPYEFRNVTRLMLGELNSSHLSIYKVPELLPISTGMLGVVWDYNYKGGGVKVKRVIKNSPADREESRLYEGDVILSIDDVDIGRDNIYRIMEGKSDELVRLRVLDRKGKKREVRIRPSGIDEIGKCLYEEWVDEQKNMVKEFSSGRLGYIHIPHMGWASVDKFQQEVYRQGLGKDGLVIDVRDNSGGWIADYLLMMLDTRVHSYTVRREDKPGYPISERLPYYVWTKPSIVLINEKTVSNGEIFAHAYKTLGIGKLVGNRTQGGVISTGTKTLKDGTVFTVPGRGWYRINDDVNLEGGGAVPDYCIYNPPYEDTQPADEQLKRAVEILLSSLSSE